MHELDIVTRAMVYAYDAHRERRSTTLGGFVRPQLIHIQEVVDLVWVSGGSPAEIAAAWLHDTVEDTSVTQEDIEREFGLEVGEMVQGLTDYDDWLALPLLERKLKQAERVQHENAGVRRVKLADQTSNVKYVAFDPPAKFTAEECTHYIAGAKAIADVCHGVSPLLDTLFDQVYQMGIERHGKRR